MTNKLPNDFIISNEYCVIEPGLTTFNKDQIITHADLMKHLEKHDINTISVLPHLSNVETLQEKVSKLLDDTEEKMNDLIEEYNESIEDNEDLSEIDTTDLSYKFSELNDYIEDYS
mgnify:CR=1 FL=1